MPLPLGHAAIGLATCETFKSADDNQSRLGTFLMAVILANLPDIDVLIGLILHNNGSVYHRGPTHSILFAVIMGLVVCKSSKLFSKLPTISFRANFCPIISHIGADYLFTNSPVSFFWPFDVSWSTGNSGWGQVLHTVFFDAIEDSGILVICTGFIVVNMILERFDIFRKIKLSALTISGGTKSRGN